MVNSDAFKNIFHDCNKNPFLSALWENEVEIRFNKLIEIQRDYLPQGEFKNQFALFNFHILLCCCIFRVSIRKYNT